MAVNSQHPEYEASLVIWSKIRDVIRGEDAIHKGGEKYLPKLSGQDDVQYRSYVNRAGFYNATGRTVEGLTGMIFRKEPVLVVPDSLKDFLQDVTLDGMSFNSFAKKGVKELVSIGRVGVLVDYPEAEEGLVTQGQVEAKNLRPFWRLYDTESIINWRVEFVNNLAQLTQVRILEQVETKSADSFDTEIIEQIRVLELTADGYQQRWFRQQRVESGKDEARWVEVKRVVPVMAGKPLTFIPFVFFGISEELAAVDKPPVLDLTNVNLGHYRTIADLEHAAHFTALPTPFIAGVTQEEVPKHIGPTKIWTANDPLAKIGMLEYTGSGLTALEQRASAKEEQMAALGARMIAPEKRMAEAAETAAIHRAGENSILADISISASRTLEKLLKISLGWMGADDDVSVELNRDFVPATMNANDLIALINARQAELISDETFFENLQRGEIIRPSRSLEEEKAAIETSPPVTLLKMSLAPEREED